MRATLSPHPDTPRAAVTSLVAEVARPRAGLLTLVYRLTATMGDVRLPPAAAPERADELWRQTCFEAFPRAAGGDGYFEFNFAPSTRWAAYRFTSYRTGMASVEGVVAPRIDFRATGAGCELRAELDLGTLPDLAAADWRLGLSAVIEAASGAKSYWALAHPPGRPDFHHVDGFALHIPSTEPS